MATISIEAVRKNFGPVEVLKDISLEIADGEFLTLLGPSGCGKSTLLRIIAGLERNDAGAIVIGGRRVDDLPARDRDIAMVFQSYALYPHMTVAQNIGLPLSMRRMNVWQRLPWIGSMLPGTAAARRTIAKDVAEAAQALDIGPLLGRKPGQLSGGQKQRVALGRAMVRHPAAFLLDEPLSNLDAKLRVQMRSELTELQRRLGATMIYVTHDQAEAMTMSDRVAVMLAGRLEQVAPPRRLYDDPETLAVAEFVGSPKINVMPVEGGFHAVRPEAMQLVAPYEAGAIAGHVRLVEHMGSESLVHVEVKGQPTPLIARIDAHAERDPQRGEAVGLKPLPHRVLKFDSEGRRVR
ncbi:ABC transporter ATP-binding protein [Reyranella aquatilis]|uniref:ABC transporter ATP-binding protein n=1 Tax=Reyranella aquatilis TaxID=2035356 RepID=A0ABS8KQW7_9HYPH|nr:ABC transporter ATP-binding protein [Reyranella aquatilis]MCC8428468.1 ABC transporter ATP-binding protein [Reyranella aquatilis]